MQRPSDPVTQFTMFWKCWLMRRGRGKPEYQPEKILREQWREPTTNSAHILRRSRDLILGHIGGR